MLSEPVNSNVIGFDFGSTFFKITLVKPGQPFTIVENTATKRKTETWLTITNEERYFGVDSLTESTKHPFTSFSQLHRFVGQEYEPEFIEYMKKNRFIVNEYASDDRGLIGWKFTRKFENGTEEETIMYTEELIAQLLKYGRQMSEKQAGATIKDCVITIPSYYTPAQRRLILDAADIAGLAVLQLIHENTAAATMFGIDRLDTNKALTVLFYNMGGMDTEVNIARYSAITEKASNKSYEHIEILAETYDKELGGQDFDLVLFNIIADRFNALKERQGKPDIRSYPKAVKRLLKEVIKVKDVLSANKQTQLKIGELADYVSLFTTIERKEFEDAAQPLFDRVLTPIEEALKRANMSIDDIDQIELLGGGIRVPKIQELLQQKLQKAELGVHLNGDEAMCFGAAFIASNSSASFKVRKVYLTVHPQVQYSIHITPVDESKLVGQAKESGDSGNEQTDSDDEIQQSQSDDSQDNAPSQKVAMVYDKEYLLYKKSDFLGQKKTLTLTYDTDMKIDVYAEQGSQETREKVATFTVKGIDTVATNDVAKQNTTSQPKVSLSFELTRSGLIQLNKAEAKLEETYTVEEKVPTPKKNKTLKVTKEASESNDTDAENKTTSTEDGTTDSTNTTSDQTEEESKPQFIQKTKKRTIPYPLTQIDKHFYGLPGLSSEQIRSARERMRWLEKRDEDKFKTEKAKNDFETVIYALRDWVNEDENVPFVGSGQKTEEVQELLRESENWLEEDGYNAKYEEYAKRFADLNGKFMNFKSRKDEYGARESAVENIRAKLLKILDKIQDLTTKKPWITEEQKKDILDRINETMTWLEEQVEKQKSVALDEDPVFKVAELEQKLKRVNAIFDRVNNIPKPKDSTTDKKKEGKGNKKKIPKNIKIDNMTFDGNQDINWDDFISVNDGDNDDSSNTQQQEETTNNQQGQQQEQQQQQEEQKKPYDASEEDL